ncbi:hypothetical protein LWI29_036849 [Acer saccharum]|uniref:Uncharacterized protein n=1 Tax=Acer saccharum TaxID=4024 RepID=A0AA39WAV5_ACESA|nr:hypothetical protein LWI29_036849 [Acer saccharum]
MARTAIRGGLAPSDPSRRRDERPIEQTFVGHPDYKKRLKERRNFIIESGISLDEFGQTGTIHCIQSGYGYGYGYGGACGDFIGKVMGIL